MKRRLRKTVKWTLTVLAVLTLVAWVGSRWWHVEGCWKWGELDGVIVALCYGQIGIDLSSILPGAGGLRYFGCERVSEPYIYWWFDFKDYRGFPPIADYFIPLWFPFLLLAVPAGWLWWRGDRRFPETACQSCGYDLSGAPHERCPECGKEV